LEHEKWDISNNIATISEALGKVKEIMIVVAEPYYEPIPTEEYPENRKSATKKAKKA